MKKIVYAILLCFIMQFISLHVKAQNTADYEGLLWYLDKKEALDSATIQRKRVVLFWGTNTCGVCNRVKKNLATESVKAILDEHYILWFCDATTYGRNSPEVSDYLSNLASVPYPAICIIDTADIKVGYGLTTGEQSAAKLRTTLNSYVDNEQIIDENESVYVYVSGNTLIVKNEILREEIRVYAMNGSLVGGFSKTEYEATCDLSTYPKGVFLVSSNSGWTHKIVVR